MRVPFARYLLAIAISILALTAVAGAIGEIKLGRKFDGTISGMNVRTVDEIYRLGFIDWFITRKIAKSGRPTIVVIGDSQLLGFGLPGNEIVTAHLQQARPGYRVFNLSIQDGRINDLIAILQRLKTRGVRPSYLVVSFKFTDFATNEDGRLVEAVIPPLFYFANLQRLLALDVEDTKPRFSDIADGQFFIYRDTRKEDYSIRDNEFRRYLARLRELIAAAASTADNVVMMAAAFATEAVPAHNGINIVDYKRRVQETVEACRAVTPVCVDLAEAFPTHYFFDISHLNRTGHRALAQHLLQYIEPLSAM